MQEQMQTHVQIQSVTNGTGANPIPNTKLVAEGGVTEGSRRNEGNIEGQDECGIEGIDVGTNADVDGRISFNIDCLTTKK